MGGIKSGIDVHKTKTLQPMDSSIIHPSIATQPPPAAKIVIPRNAPKANFSLLPISSAKKTPDGDND